MVRFWDSACTTVRTVAAGLVFVACVAESQTLAEGLSNRPSQLMPASPELVELGRQTYGNQCAACHGPEGRGDGNAAYLLDPKPRDFVTARYRLVSTWERVPTDEDLFRTISRGMPGSAMPSWAHLPEKTRWGLVHFVKSLASEPLVNEATTPSPGEGEAGTGLMSVPKAPPYDAKAKEHAAYIFKEACASCHGDEGRGDGMEEQVTSEGYPTRPRDLTRGIYKGGSDPEALYRLIVVGLPGTPMPMNDWAYGEDAWHLVRYVRALSTAPESAPAASTELIAKRVGELPRAPEDAGWAGVDAGHVQLMPLWWRNERVEEVQVQAAHDGEWIALKLTWRDAALNDDMVKQHGFTDGAAVQFSDALDPPLFAMGTDEITVNIWHWKAVWEHDLATGRAKVVDVFPRMVEVIDPGIPREAVYLTARSAGNPVAQAQRTSSVEDVNVRGFGSLTTQPRESQNVGGVGHWADGQWEVVFVRELRSPQKTDVQLRPGRSVSIALAIWEGAAEDRNGQKSISIWQRLTLQD